MTVDQFDLAGNAHTIVDGKALTERQQIALDFVRAHAPVAADEIGALLHEHRLALGGRGHNADNRCRFCPEEGRSVLRRLRELGLVRESRTLGWTPRDYKAPLAPAREPREHDHLYNEIPF